MLHNEIITPENAPDWMKDRTKLWNGVEAAEKRKDAQLAKEVILTLPRNLDTEQQKDVVRGWVDKNITSRGLVADFAIHEPDASDGGENAHAHVMFTCRPVEGDGFGKKLTGYQDGKIDSKQFLQEIRHSYQEELNTASAAAANDNDQVVFDLRSYRQRGIDRIPQPKMGPKVTQLEKMGYETARGKELKRVMALNEAMQGRRKFIRTTSDFGSGGRHGSLSEEARQDIANTWYDVMYGDGTEDSHDKGRDFYGR